MKKTPFFRAFTVVMCAFTLASCAGADSETTRADSQTVPVTQVQTQVVTESVPEAAVYYTNPLTGQKNMERDVSSNRPVAVVLKNDNNGGAPQFGISKADIVYEAAVEGGHTRLLALYADSTSADDIGPVIDSRTYFFDLALGHDAIVVQAGSTKNGNAVAKAKKVDCIDAVLADIDEVFRRDKDVSEKRGYVNSILTTGVGLRGAVSRREIRRQINEESVLKTEFAETYENCSANEGKLCVTLTVPYSSVFKPYFMYSTVTGEYTRYQYGDKHTDENGTPLKYTNVIVMFTDYTTVDKSSAEMNANITASGDGYYVCAGRYVPITWSKYSDNTQIQYYTVNGEKLTLLQGKTFVCVVPSERKINVSFE